MGSDLNITKHLQDYILKNGLKLHPIQKEIIDYNLSLGDINHLVHCSSVINIKALFHNYQYRNLF